MSTTDIEHSKECENSPQCNVLLLTYVIMPTSQFLKCLESHKGSKNSLKDTEKKKLNQKPTINEAVVDEEPKSTSSLS